VIRAGANNSVSTRKIRENRMRDTATLNEPIVLITDKRLMMTGDVVPFLDQVLRSGKRELLIICDDMSGDALSTGAVKSETGLATSADGLRWSWEGRVFAAAANGWDKATARITTAFRGDDGWVGIYDGASDISENYEERCGLARSADLRTWERIGSAPAIGAPGGPGTVRYVESVVFKERLLFFFERTRADGAHELCMSSAPISGTDRGSPG